MPHQLWSCYCCSSHWLGSPYKSSIALDRCPLVLPHLSQLGGTTCQIGLSHLALSGFQLQFPVLPTSSRWPGLPTATLLVGRGLRRRGCCFCSLTWASDGDITCWSGLEAARRLFVSRQFRAVNCCPNNCPTNSCCIVVDIVLHTAYPWLRW